MLELPCVSPEEEAKEMAEMKRPLNWVVLVGDSRDPWLAATVFGVYQYKKAAEVFAAEYRRRDSAIAVKVVRLHRPHLPSDLTTLTG